MAGWGNLFGKIAEQFQGRIERLQNEQRKLINEHKKLMAGPKSDASDKRIIIIDDRVREITKTLAAAAAR